MRGPFLGVPMIRIVVFGCLHWGRFFENSLLIAGINPKLLNPKDLNPKLKQ